MIKDLKNQNFTIQEKVKALSGHTFYLEGHAEPVNTIAISHDYKYIVTGSADKTVRV
jgi:FOG: WD40 repeat